MTARKPLYTMVLEALLQHADVAHLPLSVPHVRAQATVVVRAVSEWSAAAAAQPLRNPFEPHPQKPIPADDDQPPDHATAAGQPCHRDDCDGLAEGWRWYVARGWQPACRRHLTGAIQAGRRYNADYAEAAT